MELKIGYENILCHGCLSTGRYLSSISQEYSDLFHKLRNYDSYFYKIELQLCWECIAFLNKLKQFQTRINTAQSILKEYLHYSNEVIKPELKTLSSLKSIHINTYNEEFNEDNNEVNNESNIFYELQFDNEGKDITDCNPVEIKAEVECNIKEEHSDWEYSKNDNNDNNSHYPDPDNDSNYLPREKKIKRKKLKSNKIEKEKKDPKHYEYIENDNNDNDSDYLLKPDNDSDYWPKEKKIKTKKLKQNKTKKENAKKDPTYYGQKKYKNCATIIKQNTFFTANYVMLSECSESVCLSPTEYEDWLKKKISKSNFKKQLNYKCKECKSSFSNRRDLLRHSSCFHNKIFPKKCLVCAKIIKSSEEMIDHWTKVHTKMFKCALCAAFCRDKVDIKTHINKEHNETYKCNECDKEFGMFMEFVSHYKKVHKTCICDYCKLTFTKRDLITHIKLNHIPAYCKICKRNFVHLKYLRYHVTSTHPELIKKEKIRQKETNKELSYCVECDKQFVSYSKYKMHLTSSVKHTRAKQRVPCPECGKTFHRTHLKTHINVMHLKIKEHQCDQCPKNFAKIVSLRYHVMTVHKKIPPPKNKICDICGRGFSTNRFLRDHRNIHTGERPFKCKYCPAAFVQVTAMKNHQRRLHEKHKLS